MTVGGCGAVGGCVTVGGCGKGDWEIAGERVGEISRDTCREIGLGVPGREEGRVPGGGYGLIPIRGGRFPFSFCFCRGVCEEGAGESADGFEG